MLSLVMPVYNEAATIEASLKRLGSVSFQVPWELIVVDDGSTDGSLDLVSRDLVPSATNVVTTRATKNQGKGAAIRRGFELGHGDFLGIQDADLEYEPSEIPTLLTRLLDGDADAVFGSRQFGPHSAFSFWYVAGNRAMSLAASMIFNRYVTDVYTCYKVMTRATYESLRLSSNGFEIEAEMTGEILRSTSRVFEVPITYSARTRDEGKKIVARDGFRGLAKLLEVRLRR